MAHINSYGYDPNEPRAKLAVICEVCDKPGLLSVDRQFVLHLKHGTPMKQVGPFTRSTRCHPKVVSKCPVKKG